MKYVRQVTLIGSVLLLIAIVVLPVSAQERRLAAPTTYAYNGRELQRLEGGHTVQTWTMPNSLDTWQTLAILQAESQRQGNAPKVRYRFDQDRMYELQGNQVVAVWLLRGSQWIEDPKLDVRYVFTGRDLQRFVNGNLQQAWSMTRSRETIQLMMALQAEADEITAARTVAMNNE